MANTLGSRVVDPSDERPFEVDWTAELNPAEDTISTSAWVVAPVGLDLAGEAIITGNLITQVWVRQARAGTTYAVTNTITTVGGRTLERTFELVGQDQ